MSKAETKTPEAGTEEKKSGTFLRTSLKVVGGLAALAAVGAAAYFGVSHFRDAGTEA